MAALDAEPAVDFVTAHRKSAVVAEIPGDEYFSQQWGMTKIAAPVAWDVAWSSPGTVIAVIDTGVNQDHWDLRDRTWLNPGESALDPLTGLPTCSAAIARNGQDDDANGFIDDCLGWDWVGTDNNPADENGHGTAVAGIAAATTANFNPATGVFEGVAGVARQSRLMALRVLDSAGRGYPFDIARAIEYATRNGARVINVSITVGGANPDPNDVAMLQAAIRPAQAADALVVAASGNSGYNGVFQPAAIAGVVAVGASTETDTRAWFSNYGSRLDLVAPGVGIFSTARTPGNHAYGLYGGTGYGTSFAAPHVAGVAALVRSLRPDLTQAQVRNLLRATADDVAAPGFDPETGAGRLNAYRAVTQAAAGLRLALAADPASVPAGGQATVQVQVTTLAAARGAGDARHAPGNSELPGTHQPLTATIPAGFGGRVPITASLGAISPTIVSVDAAGQAWATFTAGALTGTARITATLGSLTATGHLTITSGLPAAIRLVADPARIATGGAAAVITATVSDEGGNAVADGTLVAFTAQPAEIGAALTPTVATRAGQAATLFISGEVSGTATIQATTGGVTAMVAVGVFAQAGAAHTVTLAAAPVELIAGPGQTSQLTATAVDRTGRPVEDGTRLDFASSLGQVNPARVTTTNGAAHAVFAAGLVAGESAITVTAAGGAHAHLALPIRPAAAALLTVTSQPQAIAVGGAAARLTAMVHDPYGNAVADGTLVLFDSDRGELRPAPARLAGEPLPGSALAVNTVNGLAHADLVSGQAAGAAHVTAAVRPSLEATTTVAILPDAPSAVALTIEPETAAVGSRVRLTAQVTDRFGNPVADGTPVSFAAERGRVEQGTVTTQGGSATTLLIASPWPGTVNVVAISGGVSAFGSLTLVGTTTYLPLLVK